MQVQYLGHCGPGKVCNIRKIVNIKYPTIFIWYHFTYLSLKVENCQMKRRKWEGIKFLKSSLISLKWINQILKLVLWMRMRPKIHVRYDSFLSFSNLCTFYSVQALLHFPCLIIFNLFRKDTQALLMEHLTSHIPALCFNDTDWIHYSLRFHSYKCKWYSRRPLSIITNDLLLALEISTSI